MAGTIRCACSIKGGLRDRRLVVGKPARICLQLSRRDLLRAETKLAGKNEGL